MITPQTIDIVKSTAPLLVEKGEELTRHFYQHMFENNPEVKPFFNSSNQDGAQQRALAAAITAYAANIDNLEALQGAVELIAQKHASLQVKAEHYPIVGSNLLTSIRHVLGEDVATDNVIDAWAEAYGFLADILIQRESAIYNENSKKPGGWDGFKNFQIIKKVPESDIVTSFYLAPEDGAPVPVFMPGQYITVRLPTEDGITTMRNYSLSHAPSTDWIRISVKREDAPQDGINEGYVSHLLHKNMDVGDHIEVAPPCGEFVFDTQTLPTRPLLFLAGGIGITPILCMLQSALHQLDNHKIILIYAAANENTQAFREEIGALQQAHHNLELHTIYSEEPDEKFKDQDNHSTGFVDEKLIRRFVPDLNAEYYFCGPNPFMVNIYNILTKNAVAPEHIHFEFFGPREELENMNGEEAN